MIGGLVAGRYEIVREGESDSVFDTFKGRDRNSGIDVFVRSVRQDLLTDPEFSETLGKVVERLSNLKQAGSERILAFERTATNTYVVTEFFEGSSLESRMRRLASLSVPVAVGVAIEICEALAPLHAAGIIHGDVSLRNVFTTSTDAVKLVSAGFWEAYAHNEKAARSKLREMSPYLAPEVTQGGMPTIASDVYAVGVLLWQILGGRPPYTGDSPATVAAKHASQPYPSLRSVIPSVPDALDKLIQKAMEKDPLHRYQSMGFLVADLKVIQDALRFGRPLSWPLRPEVEDEPVKVAPKLNAVDAKPQERKVASTQRKRREADVSDSLPVWLSGLVYMAGALVLVVVGAWIFFNSNKPKSLSVPNLVGKSVEEAQAELRPMDLKLREAKRVMNDQYPKDTIISLSPAPGEDIKQYAYIDAVVSLGSKTFKLPDFTGKTLNEAREIATQLDLRVPLEDVEYVQSADIPKGQIVGQTPDPQTMVERYSRVKLQISNGDMPVPNRTSGPQVHPSTLEMDIPSTVEGAVTVRIMMKDDQGERKVYENQHFANDHVSADITVYGSSAEFKIYFDDKLAKAYTQEFTGE